MASTTALLFDSIRAKCEREHWYGPDLFNPNEYERAIANDPNFDARWIDRVPLDDPRRSGFIYPPASEEQAQETEARLGFPLPSLLRTLYLNVANGGFGPGTGIRGIDGGYNSAIPGENETKAHTFDFTVYKEQEAQSVARGWRPLMLVPREQWLEHLLPICDLGCCMEACVDIHKRMFITEPSDSNDFYTLEHLPWAFEEWLWRWVRGEDLIVR